MTNFEKVGLFMTTFGQEVKKKPSLSSDKINNLRINLIQEELNEFKEAISNKDLKEAGTGRAKRRRTQHKDLEEAGPRRLPDPLAQVLPAEGV